MRALPLIVLLALASPAAAADYPALRRAEMAGKPVSELLKNLEFRTIVQKAVGNRYAEYRQISTGTGIPAEVIESRYLVAQGCFYRGCFPMLSTIVGIDTRTGEAVVMMTPRKRSRAEPFVTMSTPPKWQPPAPLATRLADWTHSAKSRDDE